MTLQIRDWRVLCNMRAAVISSSAALISAFIFCASSHAAETRIALVIGNAAYKTSPLKNPVNDSKAIGSALREFGFEVIERENTGFRDLVAAMAEFAVKAKTYQVRLVYYAGHGMQVKGRNYLIPVDADIASEDEVPRKAADLNDLIDRLGGIGSGMNLFILDACRNNPFNNLPTLTADGRRVRIRGVDERLGLAKMDAPLGTLVAYSTAPGSVAIDNATQKNSVYTKHLLQHLSAPGQPIEQMLKRVRIGVASETQNLQIPWEASSLMNEFCFKNSVPRQCG